MKIKMPSYFSKLFIITCSVFVLIGNSSMAKSVTITNFPQPVFAENSTFSVRALHFVLRKVSPEKANLLVDMAKQYNFNTLVVCLTDGVQLNSAPWQPRPDAWSRDTFIKWVQYAHQNGLSIVPEIKLLTHQEKFFQNRFPNLMYNSATYDPENQIVYDHVFKLLDEIINIIRPKAIHIGHDEVAGFNKRSEDMWLHSGKKMLPANLFLKDVIRLHKFLQERGISTWIWGDMLISPQEFPEMQPQPLHGSAPGYGKTLRENLPHDIVICDWHYTDNQPDFPSLSIFQTENFRVIGSTWKKLKTIRNFSNYAGDHAAYGMMATTWSYVQKGEWDIVMDIIKSSGQNFTNAN